MARAKKRTSNERTPVITSRTIAVVVILLAVVGLASARFGLGPDDAAEDVVAGAEGEGEMAAPALSEAPPLLGPVDELTDIDGWINSDATGLASYNGQVRIVQFWTFGCYNCKNTLPHLQNIYNQWNPQGLEIIGVHAPEFDYEADPANINKAVVELGVNWPVALDTEKTNFRSWQGSRRFWPRTYVVDQNGQIRFDHIGEGAYDDLEATVAYLIENGA